MFVTESSLRTKHLIRLFLMLLLPMCAAYVGARLAVGRPLFPIPVYLLVMALVIPPALCYGRTSWGTAISLDGQQFLFLRQDKAIQNIPMASIQSMRCKRNSITLRYTAGGTSKAKVIGNEGFSKTSWQELCSYLNEFMPNDRNASPGAGIASH